MIDPAVKQIYIQMLKHVGRINSIAPVSEDCFLVIVDVPMTEPVDDNTQWMRACQVILVPREKKVSKHLQYHLNRPEFDTNRIRI
ncbi:hypothetical protein LCGC14_1869710 [marine sediment metagenome]|uniref:Uncharacterized protein n=1 Tax=marine sediment metagenome TaxID=412755 RepID=A0A0F9G5A2_9ZZZZ